MPRSRASRRSRSGSGSQELELRGSRSRARSHERRPKRRRSGKEKRRHRHRTPRSTTEGRSGKSRRRHLSESRTSSQRTEQTVSRVSEVILKGMSEVVRQVKPRTEVSVGTISSGILNEFNPLTGNVDDWLHAVDEYAQIYGWDDKVTSHLALAKLRGPAEVWYRGLPTHLFTWVEWKEMLRQNFIPRRDLHKLLSNMFACVPKAHQSLYEYAFEKLALIHQLKIPLSSEDQVNLIMGGIADDNIKFTIEAAGIRDPNTLISHLKTLKSSVVSTAPNATQPSTSRVSIGAQQKQGQTVPSRVRCFTCNQTGHVRRSCPNSGSAGNDSLAIEH
jgi:hypothetical protein